MCATKLHYAIIIEHGSNIIISIAFGSVITRLYCIFQICCPVEFLNAFSPISTTTPLDPMTLLPARDACGIQNNDRIYGGVRTDIDEHIWLGLIKYDKREY